MGGGVLTEGAWDARSNAAAHGLVARGVGPGDRVALRFGAGEWVDFAITYRAVLQVGGVAVLVSGGASACDAARAVADAGACGAVGAGAPAGLAVDWTCAAVDDLVAGGVGVPITRPSDAGAVAELTYPASPLAVPVPSLRTRAELAVDLGPAVEGAFVHAWAPGSLAGRYALGLMQPGSSASVVALGRFEPDRLAEVVSARRATGCGLTPALAAAFLASGAAARHDLSSVRELVLGRAPSAGLRAGLRAAFPAAALTLLDDDRPAAEGRPPAAVSQEPMLWHEQFVPGSFNLPCLVRRYEGPLDVAALESALGELVRRHPPLRTTFTVVDGQALQVVDAHRPLRLATTDLGALDVEARDAAAAGVIEDASCRPFDVVSGPLFEPRLLRLGDDDHLLVVRLHHTVFDDWSVDVFRRELSALYGARLTGVPSPLTEPPTTFAAFASRRRERRDAAAERSWWRAELAGAPLAVQLPIADGASDDRDGGPLRLDLPPALAAAIRAVAPRLRATPFMTALAAFSVVVARATGLDDLVIGTVVAHRNASAVEPLIGCFTKKVPVRLRLDGDPTFAELVARTRGSLLGSLAHQDLGFEDALAEGVGRAAADHGVVPQVAVVFQGETPRQVPLALPGLTTSAYAVQAGARRERHFSDRPAGDGPVWGDGIYLGTFLIVSLADTSDGMTLVARGVFSRDAGYRVLDDLQSLLAEVVDDPNRPISALGTDGPPRVAPTPDDVVELRGLRIRPARLEAAMRRCQGVADVTVAVSDAGDGPRLVARVVADAGPTPTLPGLRSVLWSRRPGAPWPVELAVDGGAAAPSEVDPVAVMLVAMWQEISGRPVGPDSIYWQDFSFLQVLAEAREAGLVVDDDAVVRCRTPAVLAAALAASSPR